MFKRVAKYIAKKVKLGWSIKFGISGRNQGKLEALSQEIIDSGLPSPHDIIIADTSDEKSMQLACKSTKVILNMTGPYRFSKIVRN